MWLLCVGHAWAATARVAAETGDKLDLLPKHVRSLCPGLQPGCGQPTSYGTAAFFAMAWSMVSFPRSPFRGWVLMTQQFPILVFLGQVRSHTYLTGLFFKTGKSSFKNTYRKNEVSLKMMKGKKLKWLTLNACKIYLLFCLQS